MAIASDVPSRDHARLCDDGSMPPTGGSTFTDSGVAPSIHQTRTPEPPIAASASVVGDHLKVPKSPSAIGSRPSLRTTNTEPLSSYASQSPLGDHRGVTTWPGATTVSWPDGERSTSPRPST